MSAMGMHLRVPRSVFLPYLDDHSNEEPPDGVAYDAEVIEQREKGRDKCTIKYVRVDGKSETLDCSISDVRKWEVDFDANLAIPPSCGPNGQLNSMFH